MKQDRRSIFFEIRSIDDFNKYCPFKWDQIHKWHFVIGSVKNAIIYQTTRSDQIIINQYNPWQQIIHQLILQCTPFITSLKVEIREDHYSSNNLMPTQIHMQIPHQHLSQTHQHLDLSLLSNLNLLRYINFPSNEFIQSFLNYNNKCNEILRNILYLDLIRVNDDTMKILKQLQKLIVLKLQFEDDTLEDNDHPAIISINGIPSTSRPVTPNF